MEAIEQFIYNIYLNLLEIWYVKRDYMLMQRIQFHFQKVHLSIVIIFTILLEILICFTNDRVLIPIDNL